MEEQKTRRKTKTSTTVKDRWNKKTYDDVRLRVKKGEKEKIKADADSAGMSLNSYVIYCIEQQQKNK